MKDRKQERLELIRLLAIHTDAPARPISTQAEDFSQAKTAKRHANVAKVFAPVLDRVLEEGEYVFIDTTLLDTGKQGYLFTEDSFARSEASMDWTIAPERRLREPVYLDELNHVSAVESDLVFHFEDGHEEQAFFGIFTAYFQLLFTGILEAFRNQENV